MRRATGTPPRSSGSGGFVSGPRSRGRVLSLRGLPGCGGRRLGGCGAALRPAASAPRGWTRTGCPLWAPALTSPRYGLRSPGGPELSRFLPWRRLRWPWCWASPFSLRSPARPGPAVGRAPQPPPRPRRTPSVPLLCCRGRGPPPSDRRPRSRSGALEGGGGGSPCLKLGLQERGLNVFQRRFATCSAVV